MYQNDARQVTKLCISDILVEGHWGRGLIVRFDRRQFLSKFFSYASLLAIPSLPSFLSKNDQRYFVAFTTYFSGTLTIEEWKSIKQQYSKSHLISAHTQWYKQQGWILHEQARFLGHCSRWELIFKDKDTFLKWESEVINQRHRSFSSLYFKYETTEKTLIA